MQKLAGANQIAKADRMLFFTTSEYTAAAREYAEAVGMELVNGDGILAMVRECVRDGSVPIGLGWEEYGMTEEDYNRMLATGE